jgi:hypothetical protein
MLAEYLQNIIGFIDFGKYTNQINIAFITLCGLIIAIYGLIEKIKSNKKEKNSDLKIYNLELTNKLNTHKKNKDNGNLLIEDGKIIFSPIWLNTIYESFNNNEVQKLFDLKLIERKEYEYCRNIKQK